MGHVLALLIERHLGVRARVGFDGHESNHEALVRGDLDLYIEYTGTAQHRFLGLPHMPRDRVYEIVRTEARARRDLEWFPPLGFDNTFGVVLPAEAAQDLGAGRVSDLRAHVGALRLGAVSAFFAGGPETRFAPGGHDGFSRAYGFVFPHTVPIPPEYGATFEALRRGDVDAVVDFVLNPRVIAYDLVVLEDDRRFFAAYEACPVARGEFVRAHPGVVGLLRTLAGRVDNCKMARLNYEVEFRGEAAQVVARRFLETLGL